jgi:tetratricopeptide (TPR) repeat protein
MSTAINRAFLLMGQNRPEMAIAELRNHLAEEPNDAFAQALLAICFSEQDRLEDATQHAQQAIHLEPDLPIAHRAMGEVLFRRNRFPEALASVSEAIRLEPEESANHALAAQIHLAESRHEEALAAAERGLEADSEDVTCQNLRALALKNLRRHDDAADALNTALAKDPENSITHANKGWALLEKNQHEEALKHFQESLRLDPTTDWAREGIAAAMKSRHRFYGLMLKYFLFMSKLPARKQWGIILGIYILSRMMRGASTQHPEIAPFILPVRILLGAFVVMTWIADPLFNFVLRFDPYGRLALTSDQRNASNVTATLIGVAIVSFLAALLFKAQIGYLLGAMAFGLIIPGSAIFRCPAGARRWTMISICTVMILLGCVAIASGWMIDHRDPVPRGVKGLFTLSIALFVLALLPAAILSNFLILRRSRR